MLEKKLEAEPSKEASKDALEEDEKIENQNYQQRMEITATITTM